MEENVSGTFFRGERGRMPAWAGLSKWMLGASPHFRFWIADFRLLGPKILIPKPSIGGTWHVASLGILHFGLSILD
jgi:hypothetical protein